jgi:protein-tyrosine phosphatase
MKTVLFLCTGNFYRSRFAEEVFNHLSPRACPGWQAISRGIAVDLGINNIGAIHPATVESFEAANIPFDLSTARPPIQLDAADLKEADHIVALKADEHLPLLEERFRDWFNDTNQSRVEFWHIHDTDLASPDTALPQIRSNVLSLMHRLSGRPFRLSGS